MFDIDAEIKKIESCDFFSSMGMPGVNDESTIYIANVGRVFVEPSEVEFKGRYGEIDWLPSYPTQSDPFYDMPTPPKNLSDIRVKINRAAMAATKRLDRSKFLAGPHDFSVAARNGLCFAFRQYSSECYFGVGSRWRRIVDFYYAGRWPVGYYKGGLVVV